MTVGRYLWSKSVFLVSANFHTIKQLPAIVLEKANDFVHLRSLSALTFSLMALHFGLGNGGDFYFQGNDCSERILRHQ